MHDRNGTPLRKGDIVTIDCEITDLSQGDDFCNVSLVTVTGRRPDGDKERISAINTGVIVLRERPQPTPPPQQ